MPNVARAVASLSACFMTCLVVAGQDTPANPDADLVAAVTSDKAHLRGEYKFVRAAATKHFAKKHAASIATAFGDSASEVEAWLDANLEVKELLYTAIDPDSDNVVTALGVFLDLYKLDAARVKAYPNVAVALAVTWDNPAGVYDYRQHQTRTHSTLPDGVAKTGAVTQFEYLTKAEGAIKTAALHLPWEFLVHVVNHRTPTEEQGWATKNYLKRRAGIGGCYKDIVYDMEMLRTQSARCKLDGKPYTLSSIKEFGGVCAMQADYAARVSKSLAVPSEYVWGESNSGGLHAWVMWVELKSVQKDKVEYALMSEGRYFGDQYYVGSLSDPRTGKVITDRDLERRLGELGKAPNSSRQAELLMRAYPLVCERKELTTAQRLSYLKRVLEVYPSDDGAWLAIAELYRDGKLTDAANAASLFDQAVNTFAGFPDFTWKLAPDLLTPVKDRSMRATKFVGLAGRYEKLGRADLACEARLKLTEHYVDAKDHRAAATGLMTTIRHFPAEGRYIPKMMDKLQEVTKEYKGGTDAMGKFYQEILPKVPPRRGNEVSTYWVKMIEKAIAFFKDLNKLKEAESLERQLSAIRSGK